MLSWHLSTFCFPGRPFLKCTLLFPTLSCTTRPPGFGSPSLQSYSCCCLRGPPCCQTKMCLLQSLVYLEHGVLLNTHCFFNLHLAWLLLYHVAFFWFPTLLSPAAPVWVPWRVLASHPSGVARPRCYSPSYVLRVTFTHTHTFEITSVVMALTRTCLAHISFARVSDASVYCKPHLKLTLLDATLQVSYLPASIQTR